MASTTRKIILKSSDGAAFEVEEAVVALQSQTIKDMINGGSAHSGIVALSDVTGNILAKVIEYCNKHSSGDENELRQWDADFVKVDRDTLFDLLNAANNLKIKSLLNLIVHTVAQMMKGMNPLEICELTMRMRGFGLG